MPGRVLALAAALLMASPASAGGSVIWVELCAPGRSPTRIPLPLHPDGDRQGIGKACHAACTIPSAKRQRRMPAQR